MWFLFWFECQKTVCDSFAAPSKAKVSRVTELATPNSSACCSISLAQTNTAT